MKWPDRYHPETMAEVAGNREVKETLMYYVEHPEDMPHLLFHGKTGTGKTTLAGLLVENVLGEKLDDGMNSKSINASSDRGIDIVRGDILDWMRYSVWGNVPYKILVLEEADELTPSAQRALKTPLERYSDNCKVIFICQNKGKLIDPIVQGRVETHQFSHINSGGMRQRLREIGRREGMDMDEVDMETLCRQADGSMRNAIAKLQQEYIKQQRGVTSKEDDFFEGIKVTQ